jgi:hypothetical protein
MQQHKRFQGADLHCDCLMYNPRGEALWIWVFWKLFPFIFCSYYFYFLSRKMWVYQNNTDEMYGKQVNIVSVWTTRTPCKKVRVKWVTQSSSLFLYGSVPLQGHLFSLFLGTLSKINLTKLSFSSSSAIRILIIPSSFSLFIPAHPGEPLLGYSLGCGE